MTDSLIIEIPLGDRVFKCHTKLKAFRTLNRKYQGMLNVVDRLQAYDIDVMCDVILTGADITMSASDVEDLIEQIWRLDSEPRGRLIRDVRGYLDILMNGGRVPTGAGRVSDDTGGKA